MGLSPGSYIASAGEPQTISIDHSAVVEITSTIPTADTNLRADLHLADSLGPVDSTLLTNITYQPTSRQAQGSGSNMTTYYHYGDEGLIGTSTTDPVLQHAYGNSGYGSGEHETDEVGAYLARRAMYHPAYGVQDLNHLELPMLQANVHQYDNYLGYPGCVYQGYWSGEGYDSQNHAGSSDSGRASTIGYVDFSTRSGPDHVYPNPEHIRHIHTLHSLLPYIQPNRKLNSLNGPTLDIIEQDTGIAFAYSVPKKLLVLFLGRKIVNKFMQTVEREDNENWRGAPTVQVLYLPRGRTSKSAVKILISWMTRACQYHTMGTMKSVWIPNNTFVACSLAQTMELFGLHKDALRVDLHISRSNLVRPIFAVELEAMWNCLGENNKYVYTAIKVVGKRLLAYEERSEAMSGADEMLALLEQFPRLKARVRDPNLNESYRPVFGTEWMKKLGNTTPLNKSDHSRNPSGKGTFTNPGQMNTHTYLEQPEHNSQPINVSKSKRKVAILRITAESTPAQDSPNSEQKTNREDVEW